MKRNTHENLILIGMSGAGKSTLGVLLAKALGMHFVDTDLLIQQHSGKLLQQILDTEGTDRFLAIEEEVLTSLTLTNTVIATGGSAVYSARAMRHLKENGKAIYLEVSFDELMHRLSNITTRGIVFHGKNGLRDVLEERLPLYAHYADLRVECTGWDVEGALAQIIDALSNETRSTT